MVCFALKNLTNNEQNLDKSISVEVDDLSELDRQILVEQHLISPELSQGEEGSGIEGPGIAIGTMYGILY